MQHHIDKFCDEISPGDVRTLWDFVRQRSVATKAEVGLAFLNVQSYTMGRILGQPPVFQRSWQLTDAEIDAVFQQALDCADGKVTGQSATAIPDWLQKLITILVTVLPMLFE